MYGAFCVMNQVLALRGSYHGDTLGAMEAQAPSPYTGFYQQPWYDLIFVKDFRFFGGSFSSLQKNFVISFGRLNYHCH